MSNQNNTESFGEAAIETYLAVSNPDYTPREIEIRKRFAQEYIVDYDQIKAAIRCGFAKSFAGDQAAKFMEEPFVLQAIKQLESSIKIDDAPNDKDAIAIIKSGLFREAHFKGMGASHSARVSALAKLATIHGMEAPTKIEQTTTHKGGVMLIPAVASISEYEKMAINSQATLISHASD